MDAALAVDARRLGRLLGLSLRTIRTMDAAGKLPRPVRLNGHSVRWTVSEVEKWLAAGAPDRTTWEVLRKDGTTERS
jgi:predicted DNA-binding transcriptional regulator AlpA